jgi:hypothetical protein
MAAWQAGRPAAPKRRSACEKPTVHGPKAPHKSRLLMLAAPLGSAVAPVSEHDAIFDGINLGGI